MRHRAVIAGLVLLTLVFCLASQSQATYYNRRNIRHFDQVVGEHPWQESGSPTVDDSIVPLTICDVFTVIGLVNILIIENPVQPKAWLIEERSTDDSSSDRNPR